MLTSTIKRQRGVAAIEFAIIFVILFTIFYALVSYSFPLIILESLNHAAAQSTRAALQVDSSSQTLSSYQAQVTQVVKSTINDQLSWMPSTISSQLTKSVVFGASGPGCGTAASSSTVICVTIQYPNYTTNPVVPSITLPVVGTVPNVPSSLVASATIAP